MRRELSIYLDLLRILAAASVFLSHLSWARLSGGFLWWLQPYGHSAVIIFFVLSGFVIQFTIDEKEKNFRDYSIARFARLYSVVIPALLLTALCDGIGTHHDASKYLMERETNPLLRLCAELVFLSQSWYWNLSVLSNDPFWSLPYEFWYYQIFGALVFFRGRLRIFCVLAAALIAGPTILLLFPIWLGGVLVYRMSKGVKIENQTAVFLFALSIAAIIGLILLDGKGLIARSTSPYLPPGFSIFDFATAAAVALNIFSASFLKLPIMWAKRPITFAASLTFALYLFHMPLLHLGAAYLPEAWPVTVRGLCLALFTISIVVILGLLTERRKKDAKVIVAKVFDLFQSRHVPSI